MKLARKLALLATAPFALATVPATMTVAASTPFTVRWTAPGDDGSIGRATTYDLRYSAQPLTAANFGAATRLTGLPAPSVAGTAESYVVSGLTDGQLYYLALKTADEAGNWSLISNVFTRAGLAVGVDPSMLALSFSSPWPNPARESVRWAFTSPQAAHLQVDVYDVSGRHVHTVASGERAAGTGELAWDLRDDRGLRVEKGIYFVRARLGTTEWTKRLVIVH
jgi:hypothetical protein